MFLLRPPRHFSIQFRNATRTYTKFIPRAQFPVPPNNPFTWFPGHMLVGLRALSATITDIDLIIETRDARIPLSSRNPYLEDVCAQRRRLVLYNKRDLAGLTDKQQQVPQPPNHPQSQLEFGVGLMIEDFGLAWSPGR